MRTRRSRGLKGGKDTKDNRSNWERFWRNEYPEYDPMINYPGRAKTFFKRTPNDFKKLTTPNTYIIQRHGFSCANLEKVKDKRSWHFRVADPSLTAYGIYSLLRDQRKPEGFNGMIFVSSLVRTWQTGILEYGRYEPLTIVVSPYIKEKHGIVGDLSNMPLPFEQQMAQMGEFMTFLKGIDNPIAKEIVQHEHVIVYMGKAYPITSTVLGREGKPYVDELKRKRILTPAKSTKPTLTKNAFIPDISVIPHPSFHEYYGAKGFVYFDHWVRKNYDIKTVFVVSHSKWMQKVIEEYYGEIETQIFDENAWKLKITPDTPGNFTFEIIRGIPKPNTDEVDKMNREKEPTCHLVPKPWPKPQPIDTMEQHAEQYSEENDTQEEVINQEDPFQESGLESLTNQSYPKLVPPPPLPPLKPLRPDDPRRNYVPKLVQSATRESITSQARPRAESLPSEYDPVRPFNTEAIPSVSKVDTVPVTNEKTEVITRSYTELIYMLCDRSLTSGLNTLMASTDFKPKIVHYIKSNPYVMASDPTDTSYFKRKIPIYLFENHYLLFILLCKPYLDLFINDLETKSDSMFVKSILSLFNITVPIPVMATFLKELQQLMHDPDVYHLLLSTCSKNANKHYAFKEGHFLLSQTLLDLLLYELDVFPVTTETIDFMYTCMIDLVRYGARCSAVHYRQSASISLVERATGFELPSKVIVPFEMPIVKLDMLPNENEMFQEWESAKSGIDPHGTLSYYQQKYTNAKQRLRVEERKVQALYNKAKYQEVNLSRIHDDFLKRNSALFAEIEKIKTDYRAARDEIDPDKKLLQARKKLHHDFDQAISIYLNPLIAHHLSDEIVIKKHNEFFQKFTDPAFAEPRAGLGGSRGTSWKKTSLRPFSVKGGRYRASLYKGKRRTRANRS